MLRYLCPNCDSQLLTRGGANIGRVLQATDTGFILMSREGTRSYTYFGSIGIRLGVSSKTEFVPSSTNEQSSNEGST